jgi:hypothetical protein
MSAISILHRLLISENHGTKWLSIFYGVVCSWWETLNSQRIYTTFSRLSHLYSKTPPLPFLSFCKSTVFYKHVQ